MKKLPLFHAIAAIAVLWVIFFFAPHHAIWFVFQEWHQPLDSATSRFFLIVSLWLAIVFLDKQGAI